MTTSNTTPNTAIANHSGDDDRIFYVSTITVTETVNGDENERTIHRLFSVAVEDLDEACTVGEAVTYDSFGGDATWDDNTGSWCFSENLTVRCDQMKKVPPESLAFIKEIFNDSTPDQKTIDLVDDFLCGIWG